MYSVVGADGQVYGPIDMDTLTKWISEGRVLPTTNLIDPIDGRVIQAQHAPVLYGKFPTASAVPPPGPMPGHGPGHAPGYYPPHGQPQQIIINNSTQMIMNPPKSKVAAILLAFFLGSIGIHRFYLGHTGTGVAMLLITLCTCGWGVLLTGIWAFIDLIMIATGGLKDASGQNLA